MSDEIIEWVVEYGWMFIVGIMFLIVMTIVIVAWHFLAKVW